MELIIILASTILAFEIALNSTLADEIKGLFKLRLQDQKQLKTLSKLSFWSTLWGLKLIYLLSPLTLILSIIFSIYLKINELFNCPFCLSYHLAWIGLMIITNTTLPMALLYALFAIAFGKLYQYLN